MKKLLMSIFVVSLVLLSGQAYAAERSFIGKAIDGTDYVIDVVRTTIKGWASRDGSPVYSDEYNDDAPYRDERIGQRTEPLVYTGAGVPQENATPMEREEGVRIQSLDPL